MQPEPSTVINMAKDPVKVSESDEKVLSEWQAPKNKTGFVIFLISSLFFIIFGIVFVTLNQQIDEYRIRYNDATGCNSSYLSTDPERFCNVSFTIDRDMEAPIYFYYELDNYFQNHRVYLESRDDEQLSGTYKNIDQLGSCKPVYSNLNILGNKSNDQKLYSIVDKTKALDLDKPATPCGLIARTVFNDRYTLFSNTEQIAIDESNISWKYDRDSFKNTNKKSEQWLDHEDEHFQVWMRAAGLSKFRKLWGRIRKTLTKGTYTVQIENLYPEKKFDAKKYFALTTINALGGKNNVLVYSYLITGGICLILTIMFLFGWIREKKVKKTT